MKPVAAASGWCLLAGLVVACSPASPEAQPGSDDVARSSLFVRAVSVDEYPVVFNECLREAGFPYELTPEGTYEYGPYPEEQSQAYEAAAEACEQMYPVAEGYATDDFSPEQWEVVYEHQTREWIPCMRGLGIELGPPPTKETFLANPQWVDAETLMDQVGAAVEQGRLEGYNDWFRLCPDMPPTEALDAAGGDSR
jgi:hypothetical protein